MDQGETDRAHIKMPNDFLCHGAGDEADIRMAVLVPLAIATAQAGQGNAQLGFTFAREHCARCHAIQKSGKSPEKLAPPFREVHLRYPVDDLSEALGEGIRTGHPMMPEFRLDPDQVVDLIAYLKTLER